MHLQHFITLNNSKPTLALGANSDMGAYYSEWRKCLPYKPDPKY